MSTKEQQNEAAEAAEEVVSAEQSEQAYRGNGQAKAERRRFAVCGACEASG